jgi:subtilisin family serine protease
MPVKVLDSGGYGYYSDVADGVIYAVDNGAKVVNLSLGGPDDSTTLANAVEYAHDRGVLVVAAAGNSYGAVLYPAAYPHVLAVAATDRLDQRHPASSFGPELDIAAPGVDIYSTFRGGGYETLTGTSMATPHVSGLAALIWSFAPSLSVDQVENTIESTADDLGTPGRDDYYGYGRINAGRALRSLVLQTAPAQASFLVGDNGGPFPALSTIQVTTLSSGPITWTAAISPSVEWLSIVPPDAGTVSAVNSLPAKFVLVATRPITYGTYTTTAVVTATVSSGGQIGPLTTQVHISYLATLYIYRFPLIFKEGSGE